MCLLTSCTTHDDIGEVKVNGLSHLYFKLSIRNQMKGSFIMYQVIDQDHHELTEIEYLSDIRKDNIAPEDFCASSVDHIAYLTYLDTNEIYAIYDSKAGNGFPQAEIGDDYGSLHERGDSLLSILQNQKPYLRFGPGVN